MSVYQGQRDERGDEGERDQRANGDLATKQTMHATLLNNLSYPVYRPHIWPIKGQRTDDSARKL